jgi:hypothetical protein
VLCFPLGDGRQTSAPLQRFARWAGPANTGYGSQTSGEPA